MKTFALAIALAAMAAAQPITVRTATKAAAVSCDSSMSCCPSACCDTGCCDDCC